MKTTLLLPDALAARLKKEASERGTTMSAIVEEALRRQFRPSSDPSDLPALPRWNSGGAEVDVADRDALHDAMDGR